MKREICETCDYYNWKTGKCNHKIHFETEIPQSVIDDPEEELTEEWLEEWSNDCGGYTKEELCEEDCGDWYEEMLIGRFDED